MNSGVSVCLPLDELALDSRAQRRVLALLGIRPSDGVRHLAELCGERALDPLTTFRLLQLLGDEEESPEDVPELMELADLCHHWERRHHRQLKAELAALCVRADVLRNTTDPKDAAFVERLDQFSISVARHLKWEARLWNSLSRARWKTARMRVAMVRAANRARSEHMRFEETLSALSREAANRYAQEAGPPAWNQMRRALDQLQSLLHAQIYREQRWIFPRLVAEAPAD